MAYAYYSAITISAALCGTANSTNFPVYFAGASFLATTANGGQVQNASGYDIAFYADAGLTQKLNWETVSYTAATGAGEWHIQIPTLSASANTVFYVAYGDATVTTDQSSSAATWSNFASVYHFGTAATLSGSDSVGSATLTLNNLKPSQGILSGGAAYYSNFADTDVATASDAAYPLGVAARTITGWMTTQTFNSNAILAFYGSHGADTANGLGAISSSRFYSGYGDDVLDNAAYSNGAWTHFAGTYDGTTVTLYINGAQTASAAKSWNTTSAGSAGMTIGSLGAGQGAYIVGNIDEVRVAKIARSASWITAEYNNQSAPTIFYSVGSQQSTAPVTTTLKPVFWKLINV